MTNAKHSNARPTKLKEWQTLSQHYLDIREQHMRDWFERDPQRTTRFTIQCESLLLDYSKNRITEETVSLLMELAKAQNVETARDQMFAGEKINHTEHRAVLHTALRNPSNELREVDGVNITQAIKVQLQKMHSFTEAVRQGSWTGYTGAKITHIVNIGIGGSDLGPLMACEALKSHADTDLSVLFVSNVDGFHLTEALKKCQAKSTLFIISSKSFSTQETRLNTEAALNWFHEKGADKKAVARHFVSVTTNLKAAEACGIPAENCFAMWDWVGGRYSLWSAIGLPIALQIGMEKFEEMLAGAYEMDKHFQQAPLKENMPVILALLGIWYRNFFRTSSHAVLPYDQRLQCFPSYLQQLDMESNGKHIDKQGKVVDYATGSVIWGGAGTNGQHAYFQLLHQGTDIIPADFIFAARGDHSLTEQHDALVKNALAQMEALMHGKTAEQMQFELRLKGLDKTQQLFLLPYMVFEGNRPSSAIVMDSLTPRNLGMLIALYEHKVFVQGIIWNINSFDQWGVEYGKQLVAQLMSGDESHLQRFSSSTRALSEYLKL